MVVAALRKFADGANEKRVSELELSLELLDDLLELHALQYRPGAVFAVVLDWLKSRGGRPDGVVEKVRLPESGDPHILCFGPALNRSFLRCMRRAHAVAPYRIEEFRSETRVYAYDPNHPKDRGRYISFESNGGFAYDGFSTANGWGITRLPLSALGARPR